jgi:hypothetical protein
MKPLKPDLLAIAQSHIGPGHFVSLQCTCGAEIQGFTTITPQVKSWIEKHQPHEDAEYKRRHP